VYGVKAGASAIACGRSQNPPIVVSPTDHELTVVIPAFNEERRLPWTLAQLAAFLDQGNVDYRVLVADDGSTDGTSDLVYSRFGGRFSSIRLPRHRGKGCAVRAAMLAATGEVLAFTDADLPYELGALRSGFEQIRARQCDVVFGARDLKESECRVVRAAARRASTRVFAQIVKHLISGEATDTQCGLKLFSRRAGLEIFARTTIRGFAFDVEVVLLARQLGLSVRRIPVALVHEDASTLSLPRHAAPMAWDVLRLFLRTRLQRNRPAPAFCGPGWQEILGPDRNRRVA
jgi:dolichyl-phosphate beta-glucosyltransferase